VTNDDISAVIDGAAKKIASLGIRLSFQQDRGNGDNVYIDARLAVNDRTTGVPTHVHSLGIVARKKLISIDALETSIRDTITRLYMHECDEVIFAAGLGADPHANDVVGAK